MQSQGSTIEKNPSRIAIHIKAPLDISIQPCRATSENQTVNVIKENADSNNQHGSPPAIHYTNMTIAEIVRASR